MDRHIKKFVEDIFEIKEVGRYCFSEVCGLTFVFKKEFLFINEQMTSGEIKPLAIIYEENGEYYLAPIDVVDEIEEVVKEFVRQHLKK